MEEVEDYGNRERSGFIQQYRKMAIKENGWLPEFCEKIISIKARQMALNRPAKSHLCIRSSRANVDDERQSAEI